MFHFYLLEAVACTNGNSTIGQTLPTQQSALIDTRLHNLSFGNVNGFNTDIQIVIYIVAYASVKLASVFLNNWETPREAISATEVS